MGSDSFICQNHAHTDQEVIAICSNSELMFLYYFIKALSLEEAEFDRINNTNTTVENIEFAKKHAQNRTHCWSCGVEGTHLQEYMQKILVAISTVELTAKDKENMKSLDVVEKINKMTGITKDDIILENIPLSEKGMAQFIEDKLNMWLEQAVNIPEMFKITDKVILCPKCFEKYESSVKKEDPKTAAPSEEEVNSMEEFYTNKLKPMAEKLAKAELEIQKYKKNTALIM